VKNYNSNFKDKFKKRLYDFVLKLINFIDKLPKTNVCDVMGKQLIRSGSSVLANFIEGQSASSKKDFINYLNHSLKSANESKVWLALLRDTKNGNEKELEYLINENIEISKIIASSILTIKERRKF